MKWFISPLKLHILMIPLSSSYLLGRGYIEYFPFLDQYEDDEDDSALSDIGRKFQDEPIFSSLHYCNMIKGETGIAIETLVSFVLMMQDRETPGGGKGGGGELCGLHHIFHVGRN